MTVSELIVELQELPGDTEVMREDYGDYGDVKSIQSVEQVTIYGTHTWWTPSNAFYREWFKDKDCAGTTTGPEKTVVVIRA